ncbi:MAG: multidrug ABC transporter ATP-binding protein [Leptospiraceae bacterium]|nr:multidrug ABC transporter ATP-binding protein [Leptospiraceae bacterium]
MIQVSGLKRSFGSFVAVRNVSFEIQPGRGVVGLLGPNGAGKTTTMRMLAGYLRPDEGSITVAGIEANSEDHRLSIKGQLGYLPENNPLYPEMLVSEYLEFMGRCRGMEGAPLQEAGRRMIQELELGSHFYTPIGLLSRGFRQRVGLAGALIHDPSVIILDEPTGGLDPNQIEHIRSLIRKLAEHRTVLLSTHILQEVEDICERVIIIHGGEVVADQPTQELKRSESIQVLLKKENASIQSMYRELSELSGIQSVLFAGQKATSPENPGHLGEASDDDSQALKAMEQDSNEVSRSDTEGQQGDFHSVELQYNASPEALLPQLLQKGYVIRSYSPGRRSLQEIFQELTHR